MVLKNRFCFWFKQKFTVKTHLNLLIKSVQVSFSVGYKNCTRNPLNSGRKAIDNVIRKTERISWYRPPLVSSVSMGCLSAVMSLKVRRNSTTRSLSFFIGAICSSSHSGVSVTRSHTITRHFGESLKLGASFDSGVISLLWILYRENAAWSFIKPIPWKIHSILKIWFKIKTLKLDWTWFSNA